MGERSEVGVLEGTTLPLYAREQPAYLQIKLDIFAEMLVLVVVCQITIL